MMVPKKQRTLSTSSTRRQQASVSNHTMHAHISVQVIAQKSMKKKPLGLALQLLEEYDLDEPP